MAVMFTLSCLIICAAAAITSAAVITDDQTIILATHNALRQGVSPKATNMYKIYWNAKLASSAQAWVDSCPSGHDNDYTRRKNTNIGASVGQNYATGYPGTKDWDEVVRRWHSEVANFAYGAGSTNGSDVGHYTQVVWGASPLVGCGYKECSGVPVYICNYAWGNLGLNHPYAKGDTSCSSCQTTCKNKLCDCNGKMCKNGGTMDLNACTCTCANGFTGDECQTCPFVDQTTSYNQGECSIYSNVPDARPILCGFCPEVCPGKAINSCQNGGTLKSDCTCQCVLPYKGDTCTEMETSACSDKSYCGTPQPYGYTKPDCKYSNVPGDCPKMCGKC